MNTLHNIGSSQGLAQSVVSPPITGSAAGQKMVRGDAEVVAAVASMEIKPSLVNETSAPSREVVAKAAQQIQSFVQSMGRNLNFSVDSVTGYHIVRVTNPDTGEVIRQLPSEELLRIARSLAQINSALINQKA